MLHQTLRVITSSVLVTLPLAQAKILSCADVECPITEGSTAATCTVADRTFNAVGVAGLDSTTEALEGLSWVKAVGAQDVNNTVRRYNQSFYLGTPNGFDFGSTGACALLLFPVSNLVRFDDDDDDDDDDDVTDTEGTCQNAITDSCVSAMINSARKVDLNGLSGNAACERLQRVFSANLDPACAAFVGDSGWRGISARALSGNGSPEPISGQQNSTSNCWPVLPKSDDLRLVDSVTWIGNYDASYVMDSLFSITPILTVFFPGNGSSRLVAQSEAYLTCVRAIDLTTASNATRNSGGDGENAATRHLGGSVPALWAGVAMVVFGLFL